VVADEAGGTGYEGFQWEVIELMVIGFPQLRHFSPTFDGILRDEISMCISFIQRTMFIHAIPCDLFKTNYEHMKITVQN
jgi:hypothetical protein